MSQLIDQPTAAPTRKVAAGGIGGALSIVLIYLVELVFDLSLPSEVVASITAIISFLSSYFVREEM